MANYRWVHPSLRKLFKLALQATSTAVLHNTPAKWRLRRLILPSFVVATKHIQLLKRLGPSQTNERALVEGWMAEFEKRMDNTLTFLYSAGVSRGLPHTVVKQLAFVQMRSLYWLRERHRKTHSWNVLVNTQAASAMKTGNRKAKGDQLLDFRDRGMSAMSEVLKMAEGRDGLILGRELFKKERRLVPPSRLREDRPR